MRKKENYRNILLLDCLKFIKFCGLQESTGVPGPQSAPRGCPGTGSAQVPARRSRRCVSE